MDRKSIFVIVACIVLMVVWQSVLVPKYFTNPAPPPTADTNAPAPAATTSSVTSPAPAPASTTGATRPAFSTNATEELVVVANDNARYVFTSLGGGLKEIQLVKFPEKITRRSKEQPATNNVATLNTHAQLPVMAVLGGEAIVGDGVFEVTQTASGVRATKTLTNGLRIIKEFQPSTNYLVHVTVQLENTGDTPLSLPAQEWVVGTGTPMGSADDGSAVGLMWYDGRKTHETLRPYFDNKRLGCLPGTPRTEFRAGTSNVVWAMAKNQFFGMLAMPAQPAQEVVSRAITLPRPTEGRFSFPDSAERKGFETTLLYPATTLAPAQTQEHQVDFFIGPKEYRTLAVIGGKYGNDADKAMGFGFFGLFSKALLLFMNWLHYALSIPYGWAIIVLTIVLKVVFWPLTGASTRASQKMAALAPQLAAIKEKYKDEPAKFSQKQLELFRENKVNPMAGCLPMLVQLPVFFGLFMMLRTAIELRGASFFWAADLSQSDTLFIIPGLTFIPFLSTPDGLPFNLLPLLYISSAIWQTHITPMSPSMDATQQKLMRWMPLMFLLFLYNFSSGLALYMTVNNLLTILQTKLLKKAYPTPSAAAVPVKASVLTPASKKKK